MAEHAFALVFSLAHACGRPRSATARELAEASGFATVMAPASHGPVGSSAYACALDELTQRMAIALAIRSMAGGEVDVLAVSAAVDDYCALPNL